VTSVKLKVSYDVLPFVEMVASVESLPRDRLRVIVAVLGRNRSVVISFDDWDSLVAAVESERRADRRGGAG
jgi:hypothetical protein